MFLVNQQLGLRAADVDGIYDLWPLTVQSLWPLPLFVTTPGFPGEDKYKAFSHCRV